MKRYIGLIAVLGVFTIGYFAFAGRISEFFSVDYESDLYELKISSIEAQAALYAEGTEELFLESSSVYVTVEELALNGAIICNGEGMVNDPRTDGSTLNDLKVKITLGDDGEITATVLS